MEPGYIILKELAGNAPPTFSPLQEIMAPHVDLLILFWTTMWFFVAFVVLFKLYREYRDSRAASH